MHSPYTIILPTHFRHQYLRDALKEYADTGVNIIILDSTDTQFEGHEVYSNVEYLHLPESNFINKMRIGIEKVTTDFFVIRSDTRHIFLSGVEKSIAFLEENPDYTSCHGCYFAYRQIEKKTMLCSIYDEDSFKGLEQELPQERLHALYDPYVASFYATHRTEPWVSIFQDCDDYLSNYNSLEYYCAMRLAINGKIKRLPTAYSMVLGVGRVSPKSDEYLGLEHIFTRPDYATEREDLQHLLSTHLAGKSDLDIKQARSVIDTIAAKFLDSYSSMGKKPHPKKFAHKIEKLWLKTFGFRKRIKKQQAAHAAQQQQLAHAKSLITDSSLAELDAYLKKDHDFL